ncbi:hypothetical protein HSB1_12060 [Halogranum salarium B-1]|uniref:Uncharacterized protein n=1 Tax=Halogranum salarium B-1 TaxID=1210908 RepID=J3A566_9EURY|nr:hypothetical protein HSB1_12060 [Halogranum salarium B-1]
MFDYIAPDALDMLVTPDSPYMTTFTIDTYTIQIDRSLVRIWIE